MALMTITEVKSAAFTRTVDDIQFKDSDIEIAEFKYIRPVLTENLYNAVVADTSTYSTLITTYVKPCLAYYVKLITLEGFYTELSDRGINHLQGQNTQTVSSQARSDFKEEILLKARALEEKMLDYVNEQYYDGNSDYTLFGTTGDIIEEKQFLGGFLMGTDDSRGNPRYKDSYKKYE